MAKSLLQEVGRFPRALCLDALVEDHSEEERERILPKQGVGRLGVREAQPGLVLARRELAVVQQGGRHGRHSWRCPWTCPGDARGPGWLRIDHSAREPPELLALPQAAKGFDHVGPLPL